MSLKITALPLGRMANFVYLIVDGATRRAAVVDPAWDAPAILRAAQEADAAITEVLLTHSHHDHVNAVEAAATGVRVEIP